MRSTMCAGLAAVCGMAAAIGLADPARGISVTLTGVSPQSTVSISSDAGASFHNYLAGLDQFQGAPSNPLGLREGFVGFCVNFSQHISIGGTYTDYALTPLESAGLPPMGTAAADRIEELWGRHFTSLLTETDYGAFQTSIWEILYDSDTSLSDGSFRMESGPVRTLAQTWLDRSTARDRRQRGCTRWRARAHRTCSCQHRGARRWWSAGLRSG